MDKQAYLLGQLLTVLISDGWADANDAAKVMLNIRGTLAPALARATQGGENAKLTDLLEQIGDIPEAMRNEAQSSFWLGFYHRRRGPGRPAGTTKPEEEKRRGHEITLTDEAWEYAQGQGNASQFIERLVLAHKRRA